MVTPEEIAGVSIFAGLGPIGVRPALPRRRGHQARAGRVRGPPGRRARAVRGARRSARDGRARRRDRAVVGGREAGELFGEVPIALGTPFPLGFRAAEPTRVMRIEAARLPRDRGRRPGGRRAGSARWRASGSVGCRASSPSRRRPARSCSGTAGTRRALSLRRFLDRNQVTFRWITPDAPDAVEQWGGPLPSVDDGPVIRVVDGETVAHPELRQVAELLGLATEPAARRVRHGDRRRRPGRASLRPCTAPRRACGRS